MNTGVRMMTMEECVNALKVMKKLKLVYAHRNKYISDENLRSFILSEYGKNVNPAGRNLFGFEKVVEVVKRKVEGKMNSFLKVEVLLIHRDEKERATTIYSGAILKDLKKGNYCADPLYYGYC